jgi:hypothetical protein
VWLVDPYISSDLSKESGEVANTILTWGEQSGSHEMIASAPESSLI